MVQILHSLGNTEVASTCCQVMQRALLTALCARAVDSEKMSKSLGNFFTIREILQKYNSLALRWFLTNSQYRQPLNFSHMSLEEVLLDPLVNRKSFSGGLHGTTQPQYHVAAALHQPPWGNEKCLTYALCKCRPLTGYTMSIKPL